MHFQRGWLQVHRRLLHMVSTLKVNVSITQHSPVDSKTKGLSRRKVLLQPSSLPQHHLPAPVSRLGPYPSPVLSYRCPWQPCETGYSRSSSCLQRISHRPLHWKPEQSKRTPRYLLHSHLPDLPPGPTIPPHSCLSYSHHYLVPICEL